MDRKPTANTTDHTQACMGLSQEAFSSMTLPRKPGKGGRPATDAAASNSIRPSSTGCATGLAGASSSATSPRCAATSSTSKNKPATTRVLCAR